MQDVVPFIASRVVFLMKKKVQSEKHFLISIFFWIQKTQLLSIYIEIQKLKLE